MLTAERIEHILTRLPSLTIGVLGDLFLDRYLDLDAALTEKSIETNLDAYQVTRVRSTPGALGTIINNLVALGVGKICAISIIGDDGEGYELRQALAQLRGVDASRVITTPERRTPTYTKPMLQEAGQPARELNRLDIKNRTPTPDALQDMVSERLIDMWPQVDALIVLDQVSEVDCGVVTKLVREQLAQLGQADPSKFVLADSREQIGLFRHVGLKPNVKECETVFGFKHHPFAFMSFAPRPNVDVWDLVRRLARQAERPVFCTCGEAGILLSDPAQEFGIAQIQGYPVTGPTDIVGAGDSTNAGITSAVAAGASLAEAAAFGCLVASITVQQIGTTGTASPTQVRQRWREVIKT